MKSFLAIFFLLLQIVEFINCVGFNSSNNNINGTAGGVVMQSKMGRLVMPTGMTSG
jgi:hypothetical protein